MAEYLAPGVYIEPNIHFPPSITAAPTNIAIFIGY
ncbi:MAG: phage tail sheath protein FI, partial [Paraglaciecola sp.]